jgi:hypothetical protein
LRPTGDGLHSSAFVGQLYCQPDPVFKEFSMIGYVTVGVSDMERAKAFYSALLQDMGAYVHDPNGNKMTFFVVG